MRYRRRTCCHPLRFHSTPFTSAKSDTDAGEPAGPSAEASVGAPTAAITMGKLA